MLEIRSMGESPLRYANSGQLAPVELEQKAHNGDQSKFGWLAEPWALRAEWLELT